MSVRTFYRYVNIYNRHEHVESTVAALKLARVDDWPIIAQDKFKRDLPAFLEYIINGSRTYEPLIPESSTEGVQRQIWIMKQNRMIVARNGIMDMIENWLEEITKNYLER